MRKTLIVALVALATFSLAVAGQEAERETLSLPKLIREAIEVNPEISVLRNRLKEFVHRIKPASALPDPAIGFSLMNYPVTANPFDIGLFPMTQTQLSYTQGFPQPGTRRLRGELVKWDIRVETEDLEGKKVQIATETSKAFFELYFVDRSLEIAYRNVDELGKIIAIVKSKYESGQVSLKDVLEVQLTLSRLETSIEALKQHHSTTKAMINVILDRDPNAPLGDSPATISPTLVSLDFGSTMREAEDRSPALRALAAGVGKSSTGVELAMKEMQPSYAVRFAYGLRDGIPDLWTAGIVINFPLWRGSKQRERVAEMEAGQRTAELRIEAERNKIAFAVRKALDEISRLDEQIRIHRESNIPLARMAVETTAADYQSNRADLDDLLRSQIALLDLELALEKVITEREISIVDLYAAIGRIHGIEDGVMQQPNSELVTAADRLNWEILR